MKRNETGPTVQPSLPKPPQAPRKPSPRNNISPMGNTPPQGAQINFKPRQQPQAQISFQSQQHAQAAVKPMPQHAQASGKPMQQHRQAAVKSSQQHTPTAAKLTQQRAQTTVRPKQKTQDRFPPFHQARSPEPGKSMIPKQDPGTARVQAGPNKPVRTAPATMTASDVARKTQPQQEQGKTTAARPAGTAPARFEGAASSEKTPSSRVKLLKKILSDPKSRVAVLLSLLFLLLLLFVLSPIFIIRELVHPKLYFHDFEEISRISGLHPGQHFIQGLGGNLDSFLTGRYLKAESSIRESFPELKKIDIRLDFPGKIHFDLEERIPIAFIQNGEEAVMIDRDGVACGLTSTLPAGLPAIRGISVVSMKIGEKLTVDAPNDLQRCIAVMSALVEADFERHSGEPLLPHVEEIHSSGYRRVLLRIKPDQEKEKLSVNCSNNAYLKDHFIWLSEVLEAGILKGKLPGTLDLSGKQQVYKPEGEGQNREKREWIWQEQQSTPEEEEAAYEAAMEAANADVESEETEP